MKKDVSKKKVVRDLPLAPTPEFPREKASKAGQREQAYSADMKKYGYVKDETVSKYK